MARAAEQRRAHLRRQRTGKPRRRRRGADPAPRAPAQPHPHTSAVGCGVLQARSRRNDTLKRAVALIVWAAVIGVVAGVFLDVATFLVARYGPEADSFSYRGNGALAVPFGLGPAILAGAWVALVLRYRGFARWKEIGLAAGLVNIFLLLV